MSGDFALRNAARAALLTAGTPAEHVDEIVDLSFCAAEQAQAKILEVLERGSNAGTFLTGVGLAVAITRNHLDVMEASLRETAKALSLKATDLKVEVRP